MYGPGEYILESHWKKPKPKPGWALVKVWYAGICGSDLPRFSKTGSYHHPIILGHEFMGIVDTPSTGSKKYRGGERVAVLPLIPCGKCGGCKKNEPFHCLSYQFLGSRNDGGLAEFCLVPEENLFILPHNVDPKAGAFIEPIAVALHVVRRSGFSPGQSALIIGVGPIGLLIGLWLRIFGAKHILLADIRSESIQMARNLGFDDAHNPLCKDFNSIKDIDTVFEAAGSQEALIGAIEKVRQKGIIAVVGRETKDTMIPKEIFEKLMRKEITIEGCWGYNLIDENEFVYEMLRQGRLPAAALVTHEVPLDRATDIIEKMIDRSIYYCKVLIKVSQEAL